MKRQRDRSAGVPYTRRGYQDNGTLTVLPSSRSTTKASSVTVTCCAKGVRSSLGEVLIPGPTKLRWMLSHVTWLLPVSGVEEESVGSDPEDRGHQGDSMPGDP